MKYFILYYTGRYGVTDEFYLKGRSKKHIQERIERYSNGMLATTKGCLMTSNIKSSFLLEVNPANFPELTKRDFGIINENQSYDAVDLIIDEP